MGVMSCRRLELIGGGGCGVRVEGMGFEGGVMVGESAM